jgi:hypothetical protein
MTGSTGHHDPGGATETGRLETERCGATGRWLLPRPTDSGIARYLPR